MKNYKIIIALSALVAFSSCSSDYLDREPYGSSLTQAQYEKLSGTLEGSMRGIYSMMYTMGSSSHDAFGKRAIDMYTDLLCGDMALTAITYGWFYTDEDAQSNTDRTSYTWGFYYDMIHNTNVVLNLVSAQSDVVKKVAENGLPTAYNSKKNEFYTIDGSDTICTFTEEEALVAGYYAQALTMRGYCYSNLNFLYNDMPTQVFGAGEDFATYISVPIYNEVNMNSPQGYSRLDATYLQIENDLQTAIDYFEAFGDVLTRGSKLEADVNVARGLLAYSYLNKANLKMSSSDQYYRDPFKNALKLAKDVIESNEYSVIPNAQLCTTGFNSISDNSWIWGQEVTTETATGLASFFGQVDIHSYSYAWAGDTKVIDENLYKEISENHTWDGRAGWFNDGSANSTFKLCPDGKFFSAKSPKSTKADDIDREWLSDNVYMRIEAMYLIAAEASYRLGEYEDAKNYLKVILDQRLNLNSATAAADEAAYISGLDDSNLCAELEYNWRVEMWGEGYGLQTFRRLSTDERTRGGNHFSKAGAKIDATSGSYKFVIPSSETSYNPALKN